MASTNSIFGVTLGSPAQAALQAFDGGAGGCTTNAAFTECLGQSAGLADQVSFAATEAGPAGIVYFLSRKVTFGQPVQRQALTAKLAELLPGIIADPDMELSSSVACDRALQGGGSDRLSAAVKAFASGEVGGAEQLVPLATRCRAAFAASIADGAGGAQGFGVMLFDGRSLGRVTGGGATAQGAATAPLPAELKF